MNFKYMFSNYWAWDRTKIDVFIKLDNLLPKLYLSLFIYKHQYNNEKKEEEEEKNKVINPKLNKLLMLDSTIDMNINFYY